MDEWHYDPAEDLDETLQARLHSLRHSNLPIRAARTLSAAVLRAWLRVYHRLTIVGQHNLPAEGSFVLIANHASHLDTLCLLAALPLGRLHRTFPIAAKDYFCVTALRGLLAKIVVNALPFERRLAPWQSLSVCAQLLQGPGNVLIFFPEGTRSGAAEPAEFKPGVALLSAGRDIPVVPCHLAGTHAALPKGAWCPWPAAIRLTIGTPRNYAHLPATRESVLRICGELRQAVLTLGHTAPAVTPGARVDKKEVLLQAGP
jgi:1-acyl-sn-glycerol-3-phosphate acyltransferase